MTGQVRISKVNHLHVAEGTHAGTTLENASQSIAEFILSLVKRDQCGMGYDKVDVTVTITDSENELEIGMRYDIEAKERVDLQARTHSSLNYWVNSEYVTGEQKTVAQEWIRKVWA